MFYAKDILGKNKSEREKDPDDYLTEKMRGTTTGTIVGALIGVIYTYKRKQSVLMGAFLGGLAGGVITRLFITKKESKKNGN